MTSKTLVYRWEDGWAVFVSPTSPGPSVSLYFFLQDPSGNCVVFQSCVLYQEKLNCFCFPGYGPGLLKRSDPVLSSEAKKRLIGFVLDSGACIRPIDRCSHMISPSASTGFTRPPTISFPKFVEDDLWSSRFDSMLEFLWRRPEPLWGNVGLRLISSFHDSALPQISASGINSCLSDFSVNELVDFACHHLMILPISSKKQWIQENVKFGEFVCPTREEFDLLQALVSLPFWYTNEEWTAWVSSRDGIGPSSM